MQVCKSVRQAWGKIHFKILKYKYSILSPPSTWVQYKYFIQYLSTSISTFEIKASLHICDRIRLPHTSNSVTFIGHNLTAHHYCKQAYLRCSKCWLIGLSLFSYPCVHLSTSTNVLDPKRTHTHTHTHSHTLVVAAMLATCRTGLQWIVHNYQGVGALHW